MPSDAGQPSQVSLDTCRLDHKDVELLSAPGWPFAVRGCCAKALSSNVYSAQAVTCMHSHISVHDCHRDKRNVTKCDLSADLVQ